VGKLWESCGIDGKVQMPTLLTTTDLEALQHRVVRATRSASRMRSAGRPESIGSVANSKRVES